MTIGELDRRIEIYNVSTSANSYGELTRSYSLFRTVWAAIEWKGGSEKMDESEILPGIRKILDYLKQNNIPFALGSASKNARRILKQINLYEDFDAIVDGTDVSKAKPDPEVFLIAAVKLGVQAHNCVVFEDALAGVRAANAGNMTSIGIGSASVLGEADHVFNDFTEIELEFIEKLLRNEK